MLPQVPFASVLLEVDDRTGFLRSPGARRWEGQPAGRTETQPDLRRRGRGHEHGVDAMAQSCGVPYAVLAWTAQWYFRPEILEAASPAIVNYHHRSPLTQAFGPRTLSSSGCFYAARAAPRGSWYNSLAAVRLSSSSPNATSARRPSSTPSRSPPRRRAMPVIQAATSVPDSQ
jgi:hypothetical protein